MSSVEALEPSRGNELPTDVGSSPVRRRREWRLRAVESSVPSMRSALRTFLDATGLPADELQDLVLAACEAATNALEHAQDPTEPFFEVSAAIDGAVVTIVVHDHGHWKKPGASRFRGRGLAMMRLLADTTVACGLHGTTVIMRNASAALTGPVEEGEGGRAS